MEVAMLARTPANERHEMPRSAADAVTFVATLPAVASAVGAELRDFAAERLKAHGERIRAWSRVNSPLEFIEVELRFAAETMGAYADEAMHLHEVAEAAAEAALPDRKA
jgi:hypothetical protein